MKKSLLLSIVVLSFAFALAAKPTFTLKLLNSFPVQEIAFDPSFTEFCVADTIIIALDAADTTQIKTICYNLQGKKIDTFHLPAAFTNRQPMLFRYLDGKKQIALSSPEGINLYSLDGKLVNVVYSPDDSTYFSPDGVFSDAIEYRDVMYYRYFRVLEAGMGYGEIVTTSMTWYKEQDGRLMPMRKISFERIAEPYKKGQKNKNNFSWGFLMDSNQGRQMAFVEEKKDYYQLRFAGGSGGRKSAIHRKKNDHLNLFFTGQNFVVLTAVTDDWKVTSTSAVYDTLGHKIVPLSKVKELRDEENGGYIVDIIGNKLISCNPKQKKIRIYEVALKD
jgi:hypothetical protein